jgi:hypothetical protein
MNHFRQFAIAAVGGAMLTAACAFSAPAFAAGPEVVAGPASEPGCFVPWTDKTKFFKWPAKKGPFRIALANGFIANTWRIQMIQTAKAFAAQPDIAAQLKEFKVVSTGEDVAAQIAAINNFIDSGFDAIVVNAQNPSAFKPVINAAHTPATPLRSRSPAHAFGCMACSATEVGSDRSGLTAAPRAWPISLRNASPATRSSSRVRNSRPAGTSSR